VVEETLASPRDLRYRNKVLIPFGRSEGKVVAGFYAPGTHQIVDFDDCLVQTELSVRIALKVKELCAGLGLEPYDVRGHRGWLRHLFVRTNEEGRALVALVTLDGAFPEQDRFVSDLRSSFPEIVGILQNVQPHRTSVALGKAWMPVWGPAELEERVGRLRLRASPEAFMQVNTPASEALYAQAAAWLFEDGWRPRLAVDLYCGVGAIALWISAQAERVLGIEENRRAVENARRNALLNGILNADFTAGRVETALGILRKELDSAPAGSACAVIDPPRAGCSVTVLKSLRSQALRRLVYVSCDPATFARDAARLAKSGWKLLRVRPADLFPQTSHVESVGLFERVGL
jgi:23S rRNA (uracil1939-C5)-methyltransferase